MGEAWKIVVRNTNYEVSDRGRVRRSAPGHSTQVGRVLAKRITPRGYNIARLYLNGKHQEVKVATLVAEAFLGPRPQSYEVNHKDGNKGNDKKDNLEYLTSAGNKHHAVLTGLHRVARGGEHYKAVLTDEQVLHIVALKGKQTQKQTAAQFGVFVTAISAIYRGLNWSWLTNIVPKKRRTRCPM